MVAKAKDNSRTKQIVLLVGSILALVLIVAVIYPLLKEKGVTGKAVDVQSLEKCADDPGGDIIKVGEGEQFDAICTGIGNFGVTCDPSNSGFTKNIVINHVNSFDALCSPVDQKWTECDVDNSPEGSGGMSVAKAGEIINNNFLCASYTDTKNDVYENWHICPKEKQLLGSDGVIIKNTVSVGKNKQFTCDGTAWQECNKDNRGKIVGEGKFLCYSSATVTKWEKCLFLANSFTSDGDGVFKYWCSSGSWKACSSENNGEITKDAKRYCDGQEWTSCSPSSQGISKVNEKYYCDAKLNQFWQECKVQNSFSSDYKALCKDNIWQALPEAVVPPEGYDWADNGAPVPQVKVEEGQVISQKVRVDDKDVAVVGDNKYYCPSTQYCPGGSYKGEEDTFYCYTEKSVIPAFDNPIFLCTLESNEGIWRVCSANLPNEYKLYNEKFLCVPKNQKYAWDKCASDKISGDNKYYCDGAKWTECTSALESKATANENYICSKNKWAPAFSVGISELFEVKIQQDGKKKTIKAPATSLTNTFLCDTGTENIKFKATVCFAQDNTLVVPSLGFLRGSNQLLTEMNGLLFTYDEADQKSVSVHVIIHPQNLGVSLSENVLAQNFVNGRRLAIEVDGQYYLLKQEPAGPLDLSKLQLVSLPSEAAVPIKILASDKYQFEIQAKKVLTLTYDGTMIKVAVGKPTAALAGQVTQHNLAQEYEVVFSKEKPILLQDFNKATLVPCLSDKPSDPLTLQVCLNDDNQKPFVTLQRDVLTEYQLEKQNGAANVTLLYQWDAAAKKKQASVFYLKELDGSTEGEPTKLLYEDFVENLVESGRRVALKFDNNLYLMSHDGNVLSLPKLNLTSYTEGSITHYSSGSQSEKTIDFLVDGNKITFSRQLISPPPPFQIFGMTKEELAALPALDLTKELSTSFSSQVPVKIVKPVDYGELGRNEAADVLKLKQEFKVKGSEGQIISLNFQKPLENGSPEQGYTLLYYYAAELKGVELIKSARVFYYYNLTSDGSNTESVHEFNDAFLEMLMDKGRELALGIGSGYYVLSYVGATPTQKSFFEFEKLALTSLVGGQKFTPKVEGLKASFSVPEGTIAVEVNSAVTLMTFSSETAAKLEEKAKTESEKAATITFEPVKDYKIVLKQEQIVDIASSKEFSIDGGKYSICDKDVFVSTITDKVKLCNGSVSRILKVGEFVEIEGLLWSYAKSIESGKVKKMITIWNKFTLQPTPPAFSWLQLTDNFQKNQYPALYWNKEWFELSGTSPAFEDLEMKSLNSTSICLVHAYPGPQGEQSGLISCKKADVSEEGELETFAPNLLEIKQKLEEDDIKFTIQPIDKKLITATPFEVTPSDEAVAFISALEKPDIYIINIEKGSEVLACITINKKQATSEVTEHYVCLPKDAERTFLLSNGETIVVKVKEVKDKKTQQAIVEVSK